MGCLHDWDSRFNDSGYVLGLGFMLEGRENMFERQENMFEGLGFLPFEHRGFV